MANAPSKPTSSKSLPSSSDSSKSSPSKSTSSKTKTKQATSQRYQVPALEKGLEILEYLAEESVPLTQTQIARGLGRGPNELFRILVSLERRGYIQRDPGSGAYALTLRLFELGHNHSPYRTLLRSATRPMQRLAETVLESCHMSVLQRGKLLIIAQEESPRRLRLSTEVGSTFSMIHTASGRLLLAHCFADEQEVILANDKDFQSLSKRKQQELRRRLSTIRDQGYDEAYGEVTEGVNVISVFVGSPTGSIHAALTIPALGHKQEPQNANLLDSLRQCAEEIGRAAGLIVLPDAAENCQ